ncbi:F-box protein-like [Dorcoceras hygrometricum]|uniref:F-box protein-like n=1 Tax=Dorcoceras hygrometricum TaxID=472368 RepID=A0A2Z7B4B4_9LAMI|nr:F-box protein-like [Dorcoceras hygrometricum]
MAEQVLPTDVLIEVLIRLPVKTLLKCRSVSKSWCNLIRSRIFILSHTKRERKQRILLVNRYSTPEEGDGEVLSFANVSFPISDDSDTTLYCDIHILSHRLPQLSGEGEIVRIPIHGPCNGLVCIAFGETIYLCNPALREFKLLPPLRFPVGYSPLPSQIGFGFDQITGDYKVIQISDVPDFSEESKIRFDLYNSGSNSWKEMDARVPDISHFIGYELLYNGVMHWLAIMSPHNSACIICLDVTRESLGQYIELNGDLGRDESDLRLIEFDGRLAVVRYSPWTGTEIWVMKEYGAKESWTKQCVMGAYYTICPFQFLKNEEFMVDSEFGRCTLEESQLKGFQFYGDFHSSTTAVFYEESLISLNDIISE